MTGQAAAPGGVYARCARYAHRPGELTQVKEIDLERGDGSTLHVYDAGPDGGSERLAVFWQHGTPNIGAPPVPLLPAADRLGIRWVSYDRPGYGGSSPRPGRDVASGAADVSDIADALGLSRFAGMHPAGAAELHAATRGRAALGRYFATLAAAPRRARLGPQLCRGRPGLAEGTGRRPLSLPRRNRIRQPARPRQPELVRGIARGGRGEQAAGICAGRRGASRCGCGGVP
jgi:pimeloyl-ACP methyl ester carboxylesterase